MAAINDGGPAFPLTYTETNEHGVQFPFTQPGMSMRDWLAGQALSGLLANQVDEHPQGQGFKAVAAHYSTTAYEYADAMLAERAKGGGRG